jgi:hypothetical protein
MYLHIFSTKETAYVDNNTRMGLIYLYHTLTHTHTHEPFHPHIYAPTHTQESKVKGKAAIDVLAAHILKSPSRV